MTERWIYIGELGENGALDWGGDPNLGNIPKHLQPSIYGDDGFWIVVRLVDSGEFEGRKIDWGAWALKLNGPQLREVLTRVFSVDIRRGNAAEEHIAFADKLGPDKYVALVAAEL